MGREQRHRSLASYPQPARSTGRRQEDESGRGGGVDVDVFVAAHRREWERLEELVRRAGSLSGAEADELVSLYQRAATHLSTVRSAAPDPALVGRLSTLVARARSTVTGAQTPARRDVAEFFVR